MADPSIQRIPSIRGHFDAVNRVEQRLVEVTRALDNAGVPYAVIGGNAVASWVESAVEGAARATKDVDLLLNREDLAAAAAVLQTLDLVLDQAGSVTVFVDRKKPLPSQGVHILFAGERVRPSDVTLTPEPSQSTRSQQGFAVIDLPALLRMKLQAFRLHDQVHLQDLFRAGLITPDLAVRLPEVLRERLRQVRDTLEWDAASRPEF